MEKKTIENLSKKLNLSKTTVSKALNNCPGISIDTKNKVLTASTQYGYTPKHKKGKVAVILPSVPEYFFGGIRKKLSDKIKQQQIDSVFYVYTNLSDDSDAINCINKAIEGEVSAVIISAPDTERVRDRLCEISTKVLVILLEEFISVNNAFYIGENSYYEGEKIAKCYAEQFPDSKSFLILYAENFDTVKERINGFSDEIVKNKKEIFDLHQFNFNTTTPSASIARFLSTLEKLPDCIFCPSGTIREVQGAIYKLHSKKQIHLIGFDSKTKETNDIVKVLSIQNIEAQINKAIEYAKDFVDSNMFPSEKNTFVKNNIYK